MHELSLMESALRIATEHAGASGATRILSLTLRVGALSGVVPEALEFAFDVLREGTAADGATLHIQQEPIRARCPCSPEELFETSGPVCLCPRCSEPTADIISGREMDLVSMEVETP